MHRNKWRGSFEHLIGAHEDCGRHRNAERFRADVQARQ